MGNGGQLQYEGICRDVSIVLVDHEFIVTFHLLPIYEDDAVLGVQWLAQIGPTLFDYMIWG